MKWVTLTSFSRAYGILVSRCAVIAMVGLLALASNTASAQYTDLRQAPAGEYALDKTHAYITFSYLHQGYSRPWLRFREIDAGLRIDAEAITASSVTVNIAADSIDSGVELFDEHLRGERFFDVDNHPDIQFKSTAFAVDGQDITLTGDLMLKGVVKTVTLTGRFNQGGLHFKTKKPTLGFSATTTLQRSDWGLGYAVPMVSDEVTLLVEVEFNQR